jgi:hypothetical protein
MSHLTLEKRGFFGEKPREGYFPVYTYCETTSAASVGRRAKLFHREHKGGL